MNCWQNDKICFPEYFSAITLSKIFAGTKGGPRPKVILGVSNGILRLCVQPQQMLCGTKMFEAGAKTNHKTCLIKHCLRPMKCIEISLDPLVRNQPSWQREVSTKPKLMSMDQAEEEHCCGPTHSLGVMKCLRLQLCYVQNSESITCDTGTSKRIRILGHSHLITGVGRVLGLNPEI
jgi:hypothetical protein